MKKYIFLALLCATIFEVGGFIALASQGREPALALTLAALISLPGFIVARELMKPKDPKPTKF